MASSMLLSTLSMRTWARGKELVTFRCVSGSRQSAAHTASITAHMIRLRFRFLCMGNTS